MGNRIRKRIWPIGLIITGFVLVGRANSRISEQANLATAWPKWQVDSTAAIVGDFDGNGTQESLDLQPHFGSGGIGEGLCVLHCSDLHISDHRLPECFAAQLENEGDLNGDGNDEIGVLIRNPGDCNHVYHLLSYRDGLWQTLLTPFSISCKVMDDLSEVIRPIAGKPGEVEVLGAVHNDEGAGLSPHYNRLRVKTAAK